MYVDRKRRMVYFSENDDFLGIKFPTKIKKWGVDFKNLEHMYLYCKAKYFNDDESADEIIESISREKYIRIGHNIKGYDKEVWDKNKRRIIRELSYYKLIQRYQIKIANLIKIYYRSGYSFYYAVKDKFYGIGREIDDIKKNGITRLEGENYYGEIINEVCKSLYGSYKYKNAFTLKNMVEENFGDRKRRWDRRIIKEDNFSRVIEREITKRLRKHREALNFNYRTGVSRYVKNFKRK